jgi:CO/xanthine dehydrogenase Mo-binding subunit
VEGIVFNEKTQVPLARSGDKVKFAGEPIVMVLAESRYIAEDALADIQIDYEPLEAVVDVEKASSSDSPIIHEEIGSTLPHVVQTKAILNR